MALDRENITIIGGGIVGLSVALGLLRSGQRVVVLDGADADLRASQGNFGLVWLQGKGADHPAYARWTRDAVAAWPEFSRLLRECGGVDVRPHVADDDIGLDGFAQRAQAIVGEPIHGRGDQDGPLGEGRQGTLRLAVEQLLPRRDEAFAIADRVAVMSDGELHQVDTPEAVYHLPSSKRVAQMTATCDFIEGVVLQDGTVDTEAGIFAYDTHSGDIEPGSLVQLVIHLDDFGIDENESGAMIVQAREFRGDATVLVIALPSGATLRCRQDSHCAMPGVAAK